MAVVVRRIHTELWGFVRGWFSSAPASPFGDRVERTGGDCLRSSYAPTAPSARSPRRRARKAPLRALCALENPFRSFGGNETAVGWREVERWWQCQRQQGVRHSPVSANAAANSVLKKERSYCSGELPKWVRSASYTAAARGRFCRCQAHIKVVYYRTDLTFGLLIHLPTWSLRIPFRGPSTTRGFAVVFYSPDRNYLAVTLFISTFKMPTHLWWRGFPG